MSMILKLMNDEDLPDENLSKGCRIVGSVVEVNYHRLGTGESVLSVTYSEPIRETLTEDFVLKGNAYLLNQSGKTINSFACISYK